MNKKKFFGYLILIIFAISMCIPFIYMLLISFMTPDKIFSNPPSFIPNPRTFENYRKVFEQIPLSKYFFNSLIVSSAVTLGTVLISALAGYAFARMNFKFKNVFFLIILITMMVPSQVNIVPLFFLMREFGWINTYWALIIPALFGGFGIFLMRQHFKSFPKELEQSAKIDGCSSAGVFFKIALPLALPAVMTLAVFTFITTYNSFMWPLIVTTSESMYTLPVGIAVFKGSFRETTQWGELTACTVLSVIPVVMVFLAGKKYFINDILAGGIKE